MLIELIIALVIGIIAGTFTGLLPGIHINLVAAFLLSSLSLFAGVPSLALASFIVAMSITHTFLDFIPSIYLGAPEEDTFLSILPGHEMFREGKGHQAVVMTLYGGLFALVLILISTPIFIKFLPVIYSTAAKIIPFLLIFISLYLIFREEKIILGIITFILSGFLGVSAFNLPIKDPLLPLLSGLFGTSSLIISLNNKTSPKKQKISKLKEIFLTKKEFLKASLASSVAPFFSFLPGIGSGHAALFGSEMIRQERKGFLFLTGAANTTIMGLSFVTLYVINKTRSGTAAAVGQILKEISPTDISIILALMLFSGIIAFTLGIGLSKIFAKYLSRINYKKITIFVLFLLLLVNVTFAGPIGVVILIASTFVGIFVVKSGSRRINMMATLIIPTILYYLL